MASRTTTFRARSAKRQALRAARRAWHAELDLIEPLLTKRLSCCPLPRRLEDLVDWQQVETDDGAFEDLALDSTDLKIHTYSPDPDLTQTKRSFLCHCPLPAYGRFATPGAYPVTEDLHNRLLCVPLFGDLTSDDVDSICDLVVAAVVAPVLALPYESRAHLSSIGLFS